MHQGGTELLFAAFRDPMFGVMVSCGSGGGLTELIDDVVTERAPVDRRVRRQHAGAPADPALRAPIRRARCRSSPPRPSSRGSRSSPLTAPWPRFVFEVNPVKWTRDAAVAVDGLLIIDPD